MRHSTFVVSAAATLLLATACEAPVRHAPLASAPPSDADASPESPAAAASSEGTPSPTATGTELRIGQTTRYRDGLQVTVVSAKRTTFSQYAAGPKPGEAGIVVTVKITNGTGAVWDANLVQVSVKGGPDGNQASAVFSSEDGVSGFTGSVAKGRSATARYGFSVKPGDVSDLAIEVTPDYDHEPAIFLGAAT